MGCRFQHIMPAVALFQTASHEDHIAYGINTAQFTDGINQHHRIFRTGAIDFFQLGTQANLVIELTAQPPDLIYPVRLTGSYNKPCFRVLFVQFGKSGHCLCSSVKAVSKIFSSGAWVEPATMTGNASSPNPSSVL